LSSHILETRPQQHADIAREDRQCTDSVRVRRVRATIDAVEQQ